MAGPAADGAGGSDQAAAEEDLDTDLGGEPLQPERAMPEQADLAPRALAKMEGLPWRSNGNHAMSPGRANISLR
jgi:hypothetical protein